MTSADALRRAAELLAEGDWQAAHAIVLHGLAAEKLEAMSAAKDWDAYQEATRQAETAIRNCQVASQTIKNPPVMSVEMKSSGSNS